ncbi:unnamed protein product, partial [Leptidea sinapis]
MYGLISKILTAYGIVNTDENGSVSETIPDKPVELKNFPKLCEQRRKFPVLYKLEFQSILKPNAYIVTQGPTEETYWPASKEKDETYGDITVGIVQEEELANFHIRTFRLYKTDKN